MENVFKDLAIVVPTMNRPEFLRRAILWYRRFGIALYIGDSSAVPLDLTVRSLESTRLTHYFHTPGLNEIEASHEAVRHSTHSYLAWSGEDDLFLPEALMNSCDILNESVQTTSVFGRESVLFVIQNGKPWGCLESCRGYSDQLFRVYRREILVHAWKQAMGIPKEKKLESTSAQHAAWASIRGRILDKTLLETDFQRVGINGLFLMRQEHGARTTSKPGAIDPWRTRLGHHFPRVQYAKQILQSWCWHQTTGRCRECQFRLPSLRRKTSDVYGDFSMVEDFLKFNAS